jgi:DNA-binding IclR family transcriptional regulator
MKGGAEMSEDDLRSRPEAMDELSLMADGDLSEDSKDRNLVTALARGIEILRCFSPDQSRLGNQELAAKTGLPKATVSRLTYTLSRLGCLRKSALSGKYHLDVGLLAFGYQTLLDFSAREIARPYMVELAEYARATVAVAARDRLQMIYLDLVDGTNTFNLRRQIGSGLPLHLSAMGRAYLAVSPPSEREILLRMIEQRQGENWARVRQGLDQAFADYAEHGYCIGDWTREISSVAASLVHPEHGILTFSCSAPSFRISREQLAVDVGPRLKHMVSQIKTVAR